MFLYPRAAFRAGVDRLKGKVGRTEIVFPGDADQREQGVAPGVGQRGAHPMGSCGLGLPGRPANPKTRSPEAT